MSSPLFDQIDNIWEKHSTITSDSKIESVYMTCRFLSLSPRGFWSAYTCNLLVDIPDWAKLAYLWHTIPTQRKPFNKYPKVPSNRLSEKRAKALSRICAKFCVSKFHGLQIIGLLENQGVRVEAS